jgi:hypothetical protein
MNLGRISTTLPAPHILCNQIKRCCNLHTLLSLHTIWLWVIQGLWHQRTHIQQCASHITRSSPITGTNRQSTQSTAHTTSHQYGDTQPMPTLALNTLQYSQLTLPMKNRFTPPTCLTMLTLARRSHTLPPRPVPTSSENCYAHVCGHSVHWRTHHVLNTIICVCARKGLR